MVATDVDLTRPTLSASHSAILGLLTPSFLLARSAPCSPLVVNQRRAVVLNLLGSNSTTAVRRPGSTAPRLLAPAASRGGLTLAGCRSAPTPSRRRAPSRAEPRTGGELVGCRDFVRARPARHPGRSVGAHPYTHRPARKWLQVARSGPRHTVPGTRGVAGRPRAGKMMSDVRRALRGQSHRPSETSEGVGWAGRRQKWGSYAHRKQRWI